MKLQRKLLTVVGMLGLAFTGLSPAEATQTIPNPVTYEEFIQTDEYLELQGLIAENTARLAESNDVEISTTYGGPLYDNGVIETKNVLKKVGSDTLIKLTTAYGAIEAVRVNKTSYISLGYACAQYYPQGWTDAFNVGCGNEANNIRVRKYLKQPKLKYVSFRCTPISESCNPVDERYLKLLSGKGYLTSMADSLDLSSFADLEFLIVSLLTGVDSTFLNYDRTGLNEYLSYEPVGKSPSLFLDDGTDYVFKVSASSNWGGERNVYLLMTFDNSGQLQKSVLTYENQYLPFSVTVDYKIDSGEKILAPKSTEVTSKAKFWAANNSIQATAELLLRIAYKLNIQAKTIAKNAKRKVNLNDLISVVKKNKLTYVRIKGGIKVTKKYLGVAGSACFAIVSGRVNGKEC